MPRIADTDRQRRIERVWLWVKRHPNGVTEQEIADYTEFERRTVNNYLNELRDVGKIDKEGTLWFPLDYEETRIRSLSLSPEEAYALYLGSRLLVKQHDKRNEPAETALLKLAEVLTADAKVGHEIAQAAAELAKRPTRRGYQSVFTTLVRGYIYRKRVAFRYRPLGGRSFETLFDTYLMEPSAVGYATYAIGRSSLPDALRAYKIERIEEARLTRQTYTLPPDFPGLDILRHSWSIMMGDETAEIVLRFSPRVKERVLETQWHPSQQTSDDPEHPGFLRWQVCVADTTDMLPWIRSWGADVEVVGPPKLREDVSKEVRKMGRAYLATGQTGHPYHALYAKTAPKGEEVHLLLYHLIDVGQVALQLWSEALSAGTREWLACALGVGEDAAGRFVAFLAALHDLGKAGPAYQRKYSDPALQQRLAEAGFVLVHPGYSSATQSDTPHGTVSTWALADLLQDAGMPKKLARQLATAVGGHHGVWPAPGATDYLNDSCVPAWDQARRDLLWEVIGVFQPPAANPPAEPRERNALLTVISALTSVADWIGSREDSFPFVEQPMPTGRYAVRSATLAAEAVRRLGWTGWRATGDVKSFEELFPRLGKPRPMQQDALDAASEAALPALVIVEAPTGIGKTEIALALADGWIQRKRLRGIYIAMPTMATSNQMFERAVDYLAQRYPEDLVNVILAHGQAQISPQLLNLHLTAVGEEEEQRVAAMGWFMEQSKRTLLAPFGVGTVDQALLSILQTKHFFVRLFGLHHKVVVFDEVHAYDAYMSTLFERLLTWLRALGAPVIILSATLSDDTRRRLLQAYSGRSEPVGNAGYPQITLAAEGEPPRSVALPAPTSNDLGLAWLDAVDDHALVEYLRACLAGGGCAAIICNTVHRAQEVYQLLRDASIVPQTELTLFHARIPHTWRQEIETQVLRRYGKPQDGRSAERPARGIVVATQVIEQSLDLDFDVMVTDMAPIDLLIQRAGRLHRHDRGQRLHPRRLTIVRPQIGSDGLPDFASSAFVYEPYVLLQSYLALKDRSAVSLPAETQALIEAVYGPGAPSHPDPVWNAALAEAHAAMRKEQRATEGKAAHFLVLPPDNKYMLEQSIKQLEEDDPTVHNSFQARTRDISPGVALVGLFETDQGLSLEPDGSKVMELEHALSREDVALIDRYVINVRHWAALRHFVEQEPPPAWRKQVRLRHCRAAILGPDGYRFSAGGRAFVIKLSRELGLQITEEEA